MRINITEIHLQDSKIRKYAEEKITKLEKFHPKIEKIDVRLIFKKNRTNPYCCEINIDLPGKNLEVIDFEESIGAAVDKAQERAKRLLVKHKEKHITRDHREGILRKVKDRFRRLNVS